MSTTTHQSASARFYVLEKCRKSQKSIDRRNILQICLFVCALVLADLFLICQATCILFNSLKTIVCKKGCVQMQNGQL